jgi:WXXGXW repeat (2 copies)
MAALAMPASGQVSVVIGIAPPPIRYEPPPPPPPTPGMVWVLGFWAPQGPRYRWVSGHYEHPPFPGAYWSHPHYDRDREGWRYNEGRWEDRNHGRGHAYGHYKDGDDHRDRGHERERDHDGGHGHDHD